MRLFIAIDLSEEVRARVAEAIAIERTTIDAKWARAEGLHITLVFFGEQKPEKLHEIVATTTRVARLHPRMPLQVEGSGTFSGNSPRVLWLGVTGSEAAPGPLAASLSEALGVVSEHPQYTPHLTLARSMHRSGDPMLNEMAKRLGTRKFGRWEVTHLTVYESAGGRYKPLATVPLGA